MIFNLANLISKFNTSGQSFEIEGNCKITNYKNASALVKNPFTIIQKDGELTVDGLAQQEYKNIESSLSVFSRIASMDDNSGNLTAEDLKLARQDFGKNKSVWENLGVSAFRYDPKEDIANLTIDGHILRIDFDNPKQKADTQKAEEKKTKTVQQKTDNTPAAKQTASPTQATSSTSAKKTQTAKKTANLPDKYAGIKKEWIPYIKATAKKYGYSEELIISKVLYEGFTPKAKYKNEGGKGGLIEVGFGHTTNATHNNKFKAGFEISLQQAFDWLGQDIKDKEAKIRQFGSYYNYNNIPQPLKEMIIDVAFNRGEGRLNPKSKAFDNNYKSVKANIDEEYWGSAAVRLRQEEFPEKIKKQGKEGGLRKRNIQRFLKLMSYLKPEKVVGAMDLFNREYYYTKTLGMLKPAEADSLRAQWNNIYYNAKAKCPTQQ